MLKGEEAAKTQAKAELSSSTFPSITGGTGCAGEDMMHVHAIALKIRAALNTAMPVATQHLASHLLPFWVESGLVPHLERKLCMPSVHTVKGRSTRRPRAGAPVANRITDPPTIALRY
jgi:hypothetical protein